VDYDALVTDVNRWREALAGGATLAELVAGFTIRTPARFNMAEAAVGRHARGQLAEATALVDSSAGAASPDTAPLPRRLTFAELDREAACFAAFLRTQGVQRGDVVIVYMAQCTEAALAHLACYRLGAIVAPLSLLYGRETLRHAVSDSRARAVIATRAALDGIDGLMQELRVPSVIVAGVDRVAADEVAFDDYRRHAPLTEPVDTAADEPALLLYTSGSTGLPKGILHAHRLLLGYLASVSLFYEMQMREPGQVLWTPSDWSWIAGIVNVQLTGWFFGHTVVAGQAPFSAEWAFGFMARHGVTHTFLTPTALKRLAQIEAPRTRWPALALRVVGTGGEPCPSAVLDWSRDVLCVPVNEFYGLTEVNHLVGNCRGLYPVKPGSMGRVYPGHRIEVLGEDGAPVVPGELGQIAAHASDPTLFLGYWGQPERTAAMRKGEWILTGDFARRDAEGYFWYSGRDDDLIKSAGYRIGPAEVEDALVRHPAVAEAAVIGVSDEERGQIVKAIVRLAEGHSGSEALARELQQHVKSTLAAYKYPRAIEFVSAFPLTSTGKISRKTLRARAQAP
jgi:acetyl-CoA synthetase